MTQLLFISMYLETHPIMWEITDCTQYSTFHADLISNEDRAGMYLGLKLIMKYDAY